MTIPETLPILLCYDGSIGSQRAMEKAGALFPEHNAIVLHVWSPIAVIAAAYGGGMVSLPAYTDEELQAIALNVAAAGLAKQLPPGSTPKPRSPKSRSTAPRASSWRWPTVTTRA